MILPLGYGNNVGFKQIEKDFKIMLLIFTFRVKFEHIGQSCKQLSTASQETANTRKSYHMQIMNFLSVTLITSYTVSI